jgi:hypothetical protein
MPFNFDPPLSVADLFPIPSPAQEQLLAQDIANIAATNPDFSKALSIGDMFAVQLLHNNPNSPVLGSVVTVLNTAITDMAHNIKG